MTFDIKQSVANIPERSSKADALKGIAPGDIKDFISMGIADMSFKPPQEVLGALSREIQQGFLGYYGGISHYKDAVRRWMKRMHSWEPKSEWIYTAHGLVAALGTVMRAYTNVGDGVIVFSPVYHSFKKIINANKRKLLRKNTLLSDVFNNTFQVVCATAVITIMRNNENDKSLSKQHYIILIKLAYNILSKSKTC